MQFGEQLEGLTWLKPGLIIFQGYKTKLTPMVEQYLDAKKQNPAALLLFRMGDFYETFFEDAVTVSRALDLTLTSRSKTEDGNNLPMAGVPFRSINEYLFQLVEQGFHVAVCDQLEDPATAAGNIVKRGITQIVTPGTLCDERPGADKSSRFLTAILWRSETEKNARNRPSDSILCAIASIDMSTGYCTMTELSSAHALQSEIMRMNVREIVTCTPPSEISTDKILCGIPLTLADKGIFSQAALLEHWDSAMDNALNAPMAMPREKFLTFIQTIGQAGFDNADLVSECFCGLLAYIKELRLSVCANIEQIYPYRAQSYLQIDAATFQNLEIYTSMRGGQKNGSLLGTLDETITGPGSRLLQNWLAYPLKDEKQINMRLDAVADMTEHFECRDDIREKLKQTADLERICAKIANDRVTPRELVMLKHTLQTLPAVIQRCRTCNCAWFSQAAARLTPLDNLANTLENALSEDAPSNLNDTGFFKPGFDEQLDKCRELSQNGQQWLLDYETQQRKSTGISSLKVKYQRVFGYFIEVTKSNLSLVPETYIRSQTLTNCERFYTQSLKEYEEELLQAESRRTERELELFAGLKQTAAAHLSALLQNARILAHIDVIASFAHTAHHRQYSRPKVDASDAFELHNARHPVVERFLAKDQRFVPNDIRLENGTRLLLITGPNMAGKSTVIRQAAIITLMAQMGSFVPAQSAHIGLVDRIFSRVGASDNLALGQSTFMVEMTETANILQNATAKSLVILDEIGRGTSTYDGLSLAWAITEFLHDKIGARTLFATHYHELTELENVLSGVKNASVAVKEYKNDIIFLRKLIDGPANRSYGIQVAKLAGIPQTVLDRASQILDQLESSAHRDLTAHQAQQANIQPQRSLFDTPSPRTDIPENLLEVIHDVNRLQLDAMTPIQALNLLYRWQKKLKNFN